MERYASRVKLDYPFDVRQSRVQEKEFGLSSDKEGHSIIMKVSIYQEESNKTSIYVM